ncbi:MAG TPA: recombinase RecA [Myxococcales bacterium]
MESSKAQALIAKLRDEISRRQTAGSPDRPVLRSGFAPLDALLPGGGFPLGRVVELCGPPASGKTTLALLALAQATRGGQLAAFVDPAGELYPPAARALGADLSRLLVVRPREEELAARATALLARSRAFAAVVADLPRLVGPAGPWSRRLLEAAEAGRAAVVVLSGAPTGLDASVRISVSRSTEAELVLTVERNRMGPPGRTARGRLPLPEELGAPPASCPTAPEGGRSPQGARLVLLPGAEELGPRPRPTPR